MTSLKKWLAQTNLHKPKFKVGDKVFYYNLPSIYPGVVTEVRWDYYPKYKVQWDGSPANETPYDYYNETELAIFIDGNDVLKNML